MHAPTVIIMFNNSDLSAYILTEYALSPAKTSSCHTFDSISSGFNPLVDITNRPFAIHKFGPIQMGKITSSFSAKQRGDKLNDFVQNQWEL
jgi:hypothetical protein